MWDTTALALKPVAGLRIRTVKRSSILATTLHGSAVLPFVISTGAKRSGEISVWMLSLGNVFRHSPTPYIFAGSAIAPTFGFLRVKNSSDDFTMT